MSSVPIDMRINSREAICTLSDQTWSHGMVDKESTPVRLFTNEE